MRSRLISRLCLLCVLAFAPCAASRVAAQEPSNENSGLTLVLDQGATCLSETTLRERLLTWLETWPADATLRLEVRGSTHDPRTAVLRLHRGEQVIAERRFSPGPSGCADLHDALAIAGALMVKAALTPASPQVELEPAPAPEPPPQPEPLTPPAALPEAPPPTPLPAPRPTWSAASPKLSFVTATKKPTPRGRPYLMGGALLAFDVGASPAGGGRLAFGLPLGQGFEARLGLFGLVSRIGDLDATSGRFRTKLLSGVVDLCRQFPASGGLGVRLCAGFLPGYLRTQGFDFRTPLGASLFWPAIAAELELGVRLTPDWAARISVAPVYALREADVVARDGQQTVVGRAGVPRLGVMLGIGFAYEISRQGSTDSEHQGL
ncbi:MAG: hypothetical protein QM778_38100 [Myxococcales bacterium]